MSYRRLRSVLAIRVPSLCVRTVATQAPAVLLVGASRRGAPVAGCRIMRLRLHLTPLDGLLLLVILIWGSNFSIVKTAIEEIPAFGFNTLRMAAACLVLLTVSRLNGDAAPDRGDWPRLITLGFFGHCCYQLAFVTGLERTTVANSSLILGCMPMRSWCSTR